MKNYTYSEEAKIELTGKQFELIKLALAQGVEATVERRYIEKTMFVNTTTGKEVKTPTTEQIQKGEVVQQLDIEGTFAIPTMSFNEKITPQMIDANLIVNSIHQRNIQEGLAVEEEGTN